MNYQISGIIKNERKRRGWSQGDLATRLGDIGQQAVSRWETGASRPERKTISRLAQVLELEPEDLLVAAGYMNPTTDSPRELDQPVRPTVARLPFDQLSPERFEQFMQELVQMEQGDGETSVHRFGTEGEKQSGVDLVVQRENQIVETVQCKRRKTFGPAHVQAVVDDTEIEAERHSIALTRPASHETRLAMNRYPKWILRDIDDLSQAVRQLPTEQAIRLVETHFPGWREDFLGIPAPSPWLTTEEHFRPLRTDQLFTHKWKLIGRDSTVEGILSFIEGESPIAILIGRGGSGKTRILLEVSQRAHAAPGANVRFLGTGMGVRADEFDILPGLANLLVVIDDVHERTDLAALIAGVRRANPNAKILLSSRPYGLVQVDEYLMAVGFHSLEVPTWTLDDLRILDAQSIAAEVLGADFPQSVSLKVAEISRDCQLVTVVAAGLIKRGELEPSKLDSSDVLRRFRDYLISTARGGEPGLGLVILQGIALMQPFHIDSKDYQAALEAVASAPFDQLMPLIRDFIGAGVLLRLGNAIRIIPDLLGDVILVEACFDLESRASTGFIERCRRTILGKPWQNALVNASRVDFRVRTSANCLSSPVDSLWDDVIHEFKVAGILQRMDLLRFIRRAAYYRPERALELSRWAVVNPTSNAKETLSLGRYEYAYCDVLRELPPVLRLVAYNFEYLRDACDILWFLAQQDKRAPNQYPDHALRVLTDLAEYGQGKPVVFHEKLIDISTDWFITQQRGAIWSPFDVLEPMLATEGTDHFSSGASISLMPFAINPSAVAKLRRRIIDLAIQEMASKDLRRGVRAVKAVGSGLHYPIGMIGRRVGESERKNWDSLFLETIERLTPVAANADLDPVVSIAVRRAVGWHAYHSSSEMKKAALALLHILPESMEHELALLLSDYWNLLRHSDVDFNEAEKDLLERMMRCSKALVESETDERITELIEERLDAQIDAYGNIEGTPGRFIWTLVGMKPSVGFAICGRVITNPDSSLVEILSSCLSILGDEEPEMTIKLVNQLMETDSLRVEQAIAHSFGWGRGSRSCLLEGELALLRQFASHPDESVRMSVVFALRRLPELVPTIDKGSVIDLLIAVNFGDSKRVADEVCSVLEREGSINLQDVPIKALATILAQLRECPSIDEHFICDFLSEMSVVDPESVLRLLRQRVEDAEGGRSNEDFRALPFHWSKPLRFREDTHLKAILRSILAWIADKTDSWQRKMMGSEIFRAAAITYDDLVVDVLLEGLREGSAEYVDAVISVLGCAPGSTVFENIDFVTRFLRHAETMGEEVEKRFRGAMFKCAITGDRFDPKLEPVLQSAKQRLGACRDIADGLIPGSIEGRFYHSLERYLADEVHREEMDDSMLFDDREWE